MTMVHPEAGNKSSHGERGGLRT